MIANDLAFEYEAMAGAYTLQGPVLKFRIRVEYTSPINAPAQCIINILDGRLSVWGKEGLIEVGDLTPVVAAYIVPGGKFSVELRAQFSPGSFQRLLETAGDSRKFQIQVFYKRYTIPKHSQATDTVAKTELVGLFQLYVGSVGGKVDGITNTQQFKVDAEEWARAVEQTKAAQYATHSLLIMNTDRKYVKELLGVIRSAEGLLLAGQVKEAIGKVREM
jgi:hypothetical protein